MNNDQFTLELCRQIFDFIPKLAGAIAWPIAAAVIVFLLRNYIRKLLERLQKAETKIGDFTFGEAVVDAVVTFEKVEGQIVSAPEPTPKVIYNPVAEVLSSWAHVERLGQELLRKHSGKSPTTWRGLGTQLKHRQLIDPEHAEIFDKLRQIRNIAAHDQRQITPKEVTEYQQMIDRMTVYLNTKLGESDTQQTEP